MKKEKHMFIEDDLLVQHYKPKTIQKAINELQVFLECDMPSMIFPEEKVLGKYWKRLDSFKSREDVVKYLKIHFRVLREQMNEMIRRGD